ncbi:Zinc finger, C3HC4 type (RING finger)/Ring finger domain/zinc-RING finger domain/RING-type zinc-finger/Prokaryotic RING finger family 4/Helicase conserved C-terminal domain containing protein, putative [Angomonas deanei]|uniref:Uncharacterized protein n=1 Tax=Angomonas deanei TaxID=59799 RepID=A0A7G2CHL1_9TRYP|nr:Zinc finger, C3HC4 type (RING finger)/Ring finger domain/zinc-RING finger domain/RING-type zinc-finger/Prokaryotic RING finger family 4/Helicase conserved C-terminal domain containing protein, putative [Angomonas deanei]
MLVRCRQVCLHPYIVVAALRRCHPSLQPPQEEQDSTAPPTTTAEEEQKRKEEAQTLLTKAVNHFIDTTLKKHTKLNQNNQSMFLQELIDELRTQKLTERECIICLEKITIPSILPCGHLFCENCITHAVEAQKRCPLCKRTTKKSEILVVPTSLLGDTNHTNNENNNNDNNNNNTVVDPIQVFSSVPSEQCAVLSQWPLSLSAKTQFIIHQLQHVIPQDERVVIFSYFTSYLEYLATVLPAQQISCIQYTGKLTRRQKEKVLQSFRGESANNNNNNEVEVPPRVLLASFSASSVGLNLVCANHCILCEPSWNPGQVSQALHRVHRIGQQRPVTITKLIAKNTVEEKVEELCQRKSSLAEHCFNTPGNNNQNNNNGNNARMRTQDLIALFVDEKEEEDEESSEED